MAIYSTPGRKSVCVTLIYLWHFRTVWEIFKSHYGLVNALHLDVRSKPFHKLQGHGLALPDSKMRGEKLRMAPTHGQRRQTQCRGSSPPAPGSPSSDCFSRRLLWSSCQPGIEHYRTEGWTCSPEGGFISPLNVYAVCATVEFHWKEALSGFSPDLAPSDIKGPAIWTQTWGIRKTLMRTDTEKRRLILMHRKDRRCFSF